MRRRSVVIAGLAALLLTPARSGAQQPGAKIPRVGVLRPGESTEAAGVQRTPFEQGLRELGWTPGAGILIEYRYAEGDTHRLPMLAAELVGLKVDVIVAATAPAILAVRQATSTIPIVMSASDDPVGRGLIESLARPGGNVTGLAVQADGNLDDKRLELLKDLRPGLKSVGVLYPVLQRLVSGTPGLTGLDAAAATLGLQLQQFEIRTASALPEIFDAIDRARVEALLVRQDPIVLEPHRGEVTAFAHERRLPAVYPWRLYIDAGGLMVYGPSLADIHRRSAAYVDKILKGAKPADLPVEQPARFELVINLQVAKAIGLEVPSAVIDRADEVIE
jgi:putative tryptophan/tyrosine transport system substrate-binding protein